ncbi:MAG: ATP-dependent DNA helicase RecG [Candidatus Omnitrophica bacterium]|nr:ATP-dependent DNA helicase RecG [Candidatus Omnitrophota bacterium]
MKDPRTTSIQYLKGIGPRKAGLFQKRGISTVEDLLFWFPRRYEDRTHFTPIAELQEGQTCTVKAEILAQGQRTSYRRRGFSITEVMIGDETGRCMCSWFNQPYLGKYFKVGMQLILYGAVQRYGTRLQLVSPEFETAHEESASLDAGRIVPVYTLPEGISQRVFRRLVFRALQEYLPGVREVIPYDIRARIRLMNCAKALLAIHFPEDARIQQQAYERLSFEEFFLFQVLLALRKAGRRLKHGIQHTVGGKRVSSFVEGLPFTLTGSQRQVCEEIFADMAAAHVMQRLLQGDVGSGKTVVATLAALAAVGGGYQVAFMAPTEILARQHYEKIRRQTDARLALLAGSLGEEEKTRIVEELAAGRIDIVIGTHALIEKPVAFKNLGLVVIDEQHKFGVGQRALLPQKGVNPDILIMTATPIPRTLAITLYGDLDVSVINELPPGRPSIETIHVPPDDAARAYGIAREELDKGNQAYIIYPVIENSEAFGFAGAQKMFTHLKKHEFRKYRLGLIHGRMKTREQDAVMDEFRTGGIDLLVATTVLEVGIDVPGATCMVIEYAHHFGLSQLHQLRGRIGRGSRASRCVLIADTRGEEAARRIRAMVNYRDGFRIAEEDLRIRGPGEFFGARQHGLTELRIGEPLKQLQLLKKAREEAVRLVAGDTSLRLRQNELLRRRLLGRFPEYEKVMAVG